MTKRPYKRFLLVRDNFYKDPDAVRRRALELDYALMEEATGRVSGDVYYPRNTRQRLQKILGLPITNWETDPELGNGIFYLGFAKGQWREPPGVHFDEPYEDVTVVVYLTPELPLDCGTSLWRHKATGLEDAPLPGDARRLKIPIKTLRARLERDSCYRSRWQEIDRAGYRYNRMVAYASGMLHSATAHYGGNMQHGRIYQTFRFGVNWRRSSMHV